MSPVFDPDAEREARRRSAPAPKLSDLYQEVILDHNKNPRNYGKPAQFERQAHGHNPLCGDDFYLYLHMGSDGKIEKLGFEGSGCAISKSSASIMTTLVEGKNIREAEAFKDNVIRLLTQEGTTDATREAVGRMKIFEGVKQFPVRVKCAALIWRTLEEALKGGQQAVSTE